MHPWFIIIVLWYFFSLYNAPKEITFIIKWYKRNPKKWKLYGSAALLTFLWDFMVNWWMIIFTYVWLYISRSIIVHSTGFSFARIIIMIYSDKACCMEVSCIFEGKEINFYWAICLVLLTSWHSEIPLTTKEIRISKLFWTNSTNRFSTSFFT